jgi:Holliday junction DNA helicase RuvA
MISYIEGQIVWQDPKYVVVNASGVGYKIHTYAEGFDSFTKISFYTYTAVREQSIDIYGFLTRDELSMFELLLTVSGIGPKSALAILAVSSPRLLTEAISTGDSSRLTTVSGIGKKNAEKIVLELKDKIEHVTTHTDGSHRDTADALEALKALGYSERDARDALKKATGTNTEEKIKSALKQLI